MEAHALTAAENRKRLNKLRAQEEAPENRRARRRRAPGKNAGAANGEAKLTAAQVRQIRASDDSNAALGKRFGVSKGLIGKVKRRDLWGHVA